MSEQANESTNKVLASLHQRFVDETYGVNGLFFESIFKTQEQLANLVIGDDSEQLFAKSRVVHGGINDWLEALVKLAQTYAGRLVAIILADSQICNSEDPAQWIRLWLKDHLRKYLRQELNLEKLAHEAWKRRIAEKVPALESEGHFAPNDPSRKHTWSRVEGWLRRAADDDWAADEWPDGPPWLAPVWCEGECFVKLILKKMGACPDRLTLEQTACLIHRTEHEFAARLEYVLSVEEDEARITFAAKKGTIVSQTPPPPRVVRGSFVPTPPKPTAVLDHLPPYYPAALTAKTNLIICRAVKKFPVQTQVVELCKYVVAELSQQFAEALQNKVLRQDNARRTMQDLIHYLAVSNCGSGSAQLRGSRRQEIEEEVQRSDEWLRLEETIVRSRPSRSSSIPGTDLDKPVSYNESAELGGWAEEYLPHLKALAHHLRTGGNPDVLRGEFGSLFSEVLDRLPLSRQKSFFEDARGRRFTIPELMDVLADVKYLTGATLMDHRKQFRRRNGMARSRRSAAPVVK